MLNVWLCSKDIIWWCCNWPNLQKIPSANSASGPAVGIFGRCSTRSQPVSEPWLEELFSVRLRCEGQDEREHPNFLFPHCLRVRSALLLSLPSPPPSLPSGALFSNWLTSVLLLNAPVLHVAGDFLRSRSSYMTFCRLCLFCCARVDRCMYFLNHDVHFSPHRTLVVSYT